MGQKLTITILFVLSLFFSVKGQDITIQHISTLNGLSQNDVNSIFQDSRGFMWFATNDGLNRYDGYEFTIYREVPWDSSGIKSNLIFDICEDKNGDLWIGTSDNGIYKFEYERGTFIHLNKLLPPYQKLKTHQIRSVSVDDNMIVWIGTSKGLDIAIPNADGSYGLWFDQGVIQKNEALFTKPVNYFRHDNGDTWISGNTGFFKAVLVNNDLVVTNLRPQNRFGYYADMKYKGANILLANDGIWQYSENANGKINFRMLYKDAFREATIDNKGNLWCGNVDGIKKFKITKKKGKLQLELLEVYSNEILGKTNVYSMCHDREDNVWVGMNGDGVYRFDVGHLKMKHYRSGKKGAVSSDKIRSIYEDKHGNLWIGSEGSGVDFLPAKRNRQYEDGFVNYGINANANDDHVLCITGDERYDFLLAGVNYPTRFLYVEGSQGKVVKRKPAYSGEFLSVFCAIVDQKGVLWLGTYGGGLNRVVLGENQKVQKITNFSTESYGTSVLESDIIRSLCEDQYGNIWIGTGNGLYKLVASEKYKDSPKFILYKNEPQDSSTLSNNYILPIFESSKGEMWIGTMGGGLNRVIPGENVNEDTFMSYTMNDGLPNNVIKGILEDNDGKLWVSSNRGLSRIDVDDFTVRNFDISDGLQDYEFGELACCKRADGELVFGGVNGFNAFYPSEIGADTIAPKVMLTNFQILNQDIRPGQKFNGNVVLEKEIGATNNIKLKYSQNSFTFEFAALHFGAPLKNEYRYKLEGWDSDWVLTSSNNRIAKYTNIPSGDYTFMIEGANSNGVWSPEPVTVDVVIVPPFWRSIYALIGYMVGIISALTFWQRYSIVRAQRRNNLKMERFEQKKIEELSQMKLRFYTNISHEFRTPLTLIIGPLQKLMKQDLPRESQMESLGVINRNANILLRLINQLMDFRAFEQDKMKLEATVNDVNQFIREVHYSFQELAEQKGIKFSYIAPTESINLWYDIDKLNKILYNLLSNAFKFTQQDGKVTVQLINEQDNVVIKVIDNGYGMDEETQKHLFERFYQSSKIKNRKVGSTGIGLAFTKGLVEMHKGTIEYTSQEGLGTTFTILLKKGDAHLTDKEKVNNSTIRKDDVDTSVLIENNDVVNNEENTGIGADSDNKLKLIIVEDNDDLRKFVAGQFSEEFNVYQAADGKEGIEKILEVQPDMIISDIMMPLKDGYSLLQDVKNDERMSHIPVILLTAKTSSEYKLEGYQKGADGYVEKPFNFELLQARVRAIIDSRKKLRTFYQENIDVKPSDIAMTSADERFLTKVIGIVEENISNFDFTVEQLTDEYGMTQNLFNKKLKSLTGQTSKAFIRTIRMKRAAQLFELGRYSVADVTYEVGFNDLKYFRQCFKTEFGVTPSEYIKTHQKKE